MTERLAGGMDAGAVLVDGTVRRPVRAWSRTVHALLDHLADAGFSAAPRFLGVDGEGREMLSYLPGETVGQQLPWPAWTHSEQALVEVGRWLRDYHRAVADFVPPAAAVWREGGHWRPGLIVGHGDPAPYNAVWNADGLVGLIDWDNAGPVRAEDDLAWVAFSWTPLHTPEVAVREGFTDFSSLRDRLGTLLGGYGWAGTTQDVLRLVDGRLERQVAAMRATAQAGDPVYQRMLDQGLDVLLEDARTRIASL